tara:strand:- start:446 stop:604 length:159 start_codon:yes stop_codon:yes gene_type:complete
MNTQNKDKAADKLSEILSVMSLEERKVILNSMDTDIRSLVIEKISSMNGAKK